MTITKKNVIDYIIVINTEYNISQDENAVKLRAENWCFSLCQYPKELCDLAVKNVIQSSEYPPRLANIINEIKSLISLKEKAPEILWNELKSTFYEVNHNASAYWYDMREKNGKTQGENARIKNQEIYNRLDETTKQYIRNVSELVEIATMEDDDLKFEKNRFLKRIPQIREVESAKKELPTAMKEFLNIDSEDKKMIGG